MSERMNNWIMATLIDLAAMLALCVVIVIAMIGETWALWAIGLFGVNMFVGAAVWAWADDAEHSLLHYVERAPNETLKIITVHLWPFAVWLKWRGWR